MLGVDLLIITPTSRSLKVGDIAEFCSARPLLGIANGAGWETHPTAFSLRHTPRSPLLPQEIGLSRAAWRVREGGLTLLHRHYERRTLHWRAWEGRARADMGC